jgi:hypothetical protein
VEGGAQVRAWKWARVALGVVLSAAALLAQQTSILGTVAEFRVDSLQLAVKTDAGTTRLFPIGPDTEVMRVPPGETTLEHATASRLADIALGDRVLATFVDGLTEARRIVVVSLGDIARRNEAERADWRKRGVSGVVTACNGSEITLALRTAQAGQTAVVAASAKTKVRRYAEGSVTFTAAVPSSMAAISVGDQVQTRGEKSADGARIAADDVVFGTFLTKLGSITEVDPETRTIRIAEPADGRTWTVRLTAQSQLKKMPDMRSMFAVASSGGHAASAPRPGLKDLDMAQMLLSLPPARFDDLKVGGGVVLTSTGGDTRGNTGGLTAIMLLTNADLLVQMSKPAPKGEAGGPMDAFIRMHGGMLGGGSSLSLPAIIP